MLTLDLAMPGLDGIGVLRALRDAASPIPVVVVSAFSPAHGARAVDALAEGAVDLVAKPSAGNSPTDFFRELGDKVRAAAASRRSPRLAATAAAAAPRVRRAGTAARRKRHPRPADGGHPCSTGGPRALAELLPMLPARLGDGVLIVQHMPAGFTSSLATRLDAASKLHVVEAAGNEPLDPGTALLAPGGSHLRLDARSHSRLSDEAEIGGLRPRADLTIADAAAAFGQRTLLVVLTGMGKDGLEGARAVRAAGGRILVEAESTCTVYGCRARSPRRGWPTPSCRCPSSPPRSSWRPGHERPRCQA